MWYAHLKTIKTIKSCKISTILLKLNYSKIQQTVRYKLHLSVFVNILSFAKKKIDKKS